MRVSIARLVGSQRNLSPALLSCLRGRQTGRSQPAVRNQPFDDFRVAEQWFFANRAETKTKPENGIAEHTVDGSTFSIELQASLADVLLVQNSSKTVLVGRAGLEPATNGL